MRIGDFAKVNNISIDTIRHYMDLGLILPEKNGGKYTFDQKCSDDLEDIILFKNLGFKLNEIQTFFRFKRLGKHSPYQYTHYYKTLFEQKQTEIEKKINDFQEMKKNLQHKIECLESQETLPTTKLGIPLQNLSLLACNGCQGDLNIKSADIQNNQIINGTLECNCGEQFFVKEGILFDQNQYIEMEKEFNELINDQIEDHMEFVITDYIKETDDKYLDNIYKSMDWMIKKIDFNDVEQKNVLELGSGFGFFLRQLYDLLPSNTTYFAVDHDFKRHLFLKSLLETSKTQKNIIFICTDFLKIPIKKNSIDYVFDFTGTSNYSFDHETFLLREMNHYFKQGVSLNGTYLLFKNFHENSYIKEPNRKNFNLQNVKNELEQLSFNKIEHYISNDFEQGGKYENFFVEGEKVFGYLYCGRRLG